VIIGISAAFIICVVIVVVVLIACSYGKVEMTDVGLLYSHASRRIDREELYTAGRYYMGVGGEFFTFPITQQEMKLPVFESRTKDGLKIELQISINFKIQKDLKKVLAIYDHFGTSYDGYVARLAMNIVRDASAEFDAYSYSVNRSIVSARMESDIRDDMDEIGFTLESLQLLNIQFPKVFSATLAETLMYQQQVTQAEKNMVAEVVALENRLNQSSITALGLLADANSTATSIKENAQADAGSLTVALVNEGESHKNMIQMFYDELPTSLSEDDRKAKAKKLFVQWYWMNQLGSSAAPKDIAVGVPQNLVDMPVA